MKNFWQKWLLGLLLSGALALLSGSVWAQAWQHIGASGFSAGTGSSMALDAADVPYVAYVDQDNGNKISVMKLSGSNWVPVGTTVSTGMALGPSLVLDSSGNPYVAYKDYDQSDKITVMRFDSGTSNWVTVGSAGFSAAIAYSPSLTINKATGTLYVAYVDTSTNRVSVWSNANNNSPWVSVGTAAGTSTSSPSLALNSAGTIYVAYIDGTTNQVVVMTGNALTAVATTGLTETAAYAPSLAMNGATPNVAYVDSSTNNVLVKTFGGASWSNSGTGLTGQSFYAPFLAMSGVTPYVAYADWNNGGKVTVMELDAGAWIPVGTQGFSEENANSPSLAISAAGVPYTSYSYLDSASFTQRVSVMGFTAPAGPTYSITLSQNAPYDFGSMNFGYPTAPLPLTVTVTSTGNQATGALSVSLTGAQAADFAISNDLVSGAGLASGAHETFDVAPKTGLAVGVHTATVTVSGANVVTQTFTVTFTVNAAPVVLTGVAVKTQPTLLSYTVGDALDLSGLVVTLSYSDASTHDLTFGVDDLAAAGVTMSPADGTILALADNGKPVTVSIGAFSATTSNLTVNAPAVVLSGVTVKTQPTLLSYTVGDALDLSGLVVTLSYSDASTHDLTFGVDDLAAAGVTFSPDNGTVLALADNGKPVTVSVGAFSATTANLTVSAPAVVLSGVAVKTQPTSLSYTVGDALDLSGLVVTLSYSDASTLDLTFGVDDLAAAGVTFSPDNGTVLALADNGKPVTVSVGVFTATTSNLTVNAPPPQPGSPVITTASLPDGAIGVPYRAALSSNDPAATWAITSGALPPGLTLDPSGVISGTPQAPAATAHFAVTATDIGGTSAAVSFDIIILISPPGGGLTQGIPALNSTMLMLLAVFTLLLGGIAVGGTEYARNRRKG